MSAGTALFLKLKDGYRMEKPKFATNELWVCRLLIMFEMVMNLLYLIYWWCNNIILWHHFLSWIFCNTDEKIAKQHSLLSSFRSIEILISFNFVQFCLQFFNLQSNFIFHRYKMMLLCWQEVPHLRPNFDQLQQMIANMLDRSVREHYISLNEPYQNMNHWNADQISYLKMLTSSQDQTHSSANDRSSISYC